MKTIAKLKEEITGLKQKNLRIIIVAIIFALLSIVLVVTNGVTYEKLDHCLTVFTELEDVSFQMCNNFNYLADITEGLIVDHLNETFRFEVLPNCEAFK